MKHGKKPPLDVGRLEEEFKSAGVQARHLAEEITRQVQELLDANSISLSFPIQQRVKTWASLNEKLDRKPLRLKSLKDLDDLVGLRLILQFNRDALKVCKLIEQNFKVLKKYNTGDRLSTDQFGYSSMHFVIALPDSWLAIPTFSQMKGWRAEIQIRTTAQHIWAAASHTLQYKQEGSVPAPVRRAIHRVSALLEMVDLEFERLLEQRESYRSEAGQVAPDAALNVDLLETLLDNLLPGTNKDQDGEDYADLLPNLVEFKIVDRKGLTELVKKHLPAALVNEQQHLEHLRKNPEEVPWSSSLSRMDLNVYYTHVGLVRICLSLAFGEAWTKYTSRVWKISPSKQRKRS